MDPDQFCRALVTGACRHITDNPDYNPLNFQPATGSDQHRWHYRGQPTLYLAGSHKVLAGEWARHLTDDLPGAIAVVALPRRIYEMHVSLEYVLDLRDPALCATLSLHGAPYCFLRDRHLCRETATRLRRDTRAQALLVPSMALLDQPIHWAMVLFVDKLPTYPAPFITAVYADGMLALRP